MYRSDVTKRFVSFKLVSILLILITGSSFINKLDPYPAPLKFHVMVMSAADAIRLADRTSDFNHFVLQNQNPDNHGPGGGNPRHNFTLITFAYFGTNPNPDSTTIYLSESPRDWPNRLQIKDITGNVKLANLMLSKAKLAATIPPDGRGFAYLVFMPIEGDNEMNPNRSTEKNYVCYEIYPVRRDGTRIGERIIKNGKETFALSEIVHPSPPAGFD